MHKQSVFISIIFLVGLLLSCNSGKEVDSFFEGMMEIHHKDMVVWGEIPILKKSIKKELDAFEAKRMEGPIDTIRVQALNQGIAHLETANDAMNDWMHQFEKPKKGISEEEALSYLVEQKKSMVAMGKEVSEAVIEAKELLKTASQ